MFLGLLCFQRQDFWSSVWNWYFCWYTTCKQNFRCLCSCDKWMSNLQGFTKSGGSLRICSDKNTSQLQMIVQVWALVGAIFPSINSLVLRSTLKGILDEPKNHKCSQPADQTETTPPPPRLNKNHPEEQQLWHNSPSVDPEKLSSQLETSSAFPSAMEVTLSLLSNKRTHGIKKDWWVV